MRNFTRPVRIVIALLVFGAMVPLGSCAQEAKPEKIATAELVKRLGHAQEHIRIRAIVELVWRADEADEFAIPLATAMAGPGEYSRQTAQLAFRFLGERVVEPIRPLVESDEIADFELGCKVIHEIGDPAEAFRDVLVRRLRNATELPERVAAIHALTGFSNGSPESVDILKQLLDADFYQFSLHALRLLDATGSESAEALPEIRDLLENAPPSKKSLACLVLSAIGKTDHYDPVPELIASLDRYVVQVRISAMIGLGRLGASSEAAVPRLKEISEVSGRNLQARAIFTLWQITGDAQPCVNQLIELSKTEEYEVEAIELLGLMGDGGGNAVGYLSELLLKADPGKIEAVIEALGDIGAPAAPTVEAIAQVEQNDSDFHLRLVALVARTKITAAQASLSSGN